MIHLVPVLVLCLPGLALALQGDPSAPQAPAEVLTTADEAQTKRLLKQHAKSSKEGDGAELVKSFQEMALFDNAEFISPAKEGLTYRASRVDEKWAKAEAEELGLVGKDELEALLVERVSAVQAAAAGVLANHPGDGQVAGALARAFKDKELRKERPKALAAVILALGKVEYQKFEGEVFSEFKRAGDTEVARACVRYFGLIKTKDMSIVRRLCNELSSPEPANVDAASNPPAGYWEQRWKIWNAIRRDVSWSLQEITGQVFKPSEGEHPSDERKALEYVKEHAKELGLK